MRNRIFEITLALAVVTTLLQASVVSASRDKNAKPTVFTVRIENISAANSLIASDGTRFSFALSPGHWLLHDGQSGLFVEGKHASKGLESQSEDGDPSALAMSSDMNHHPSSLHGVFNTPVGMMTPGPIRPGGSYEFSFSASPGMRLSMTLMNGQSNDMFYGPDENGIALFDNKGMPILGDITEKMILWDAGTEVNQELGIGADQGPRQKAPNTGADEHGVVTRATSSAYYTKNAEMFRVTITTQQ